jgi:hypothetical protein
LTRIGHAGRSREAYGTLRSPGGNRLETLKRDRSGQPSIRKEGAEDVEIVDYHR